MLAEMPPVRLSSSLWFLHDQCCWLKAVESSSLWVRQWQDWSVSTCLRIVGAPSFEATPLFERSIMWDYKCIIWLLTAITSPETCVATGSLVTHMTLVGFCRWDWLSLEMMVNIIVLYGCVNDWSCSCSVCSCSILEFQQTIWGLKHGQKVEVRIGFMLGAGWLGLGWELGNVLCIWKSSQRQ